MGAGGWQRLGCLGTVAGSAPWARTHAALPVVDRDDEGGCRLYVSTRDSDGRAHIARCALTLDPEPCLGEVAARPVLAPGDIGTFDDSGVTGSCIVADGRKRFLYYTGWTRGVTVPFYLFAGLAVSDDGGATFERVSRAPVLDRDAVDPYLTASPFVLREGGRWRMWYVSGTSWTRDRGGARHRYHVKYAESADGIHWRRDGRVCIDYADAGEYAISRPCVTKDPDGYHMWFASRGDAYAIHYATSADGLAWTRRAGNQELKPSGTGWESAMVEYPWIVDDGARRFMLYNGNDYGRTGVGVAVRDRVR